MDLEESFNDFRSPKPKVSNKTNTQKPKKLKKNGDFSGSQVHSNAAAKKKEASLKKFLYSAPNYKYHNAHENKVSVSETQIKCYQKEEIAVINASDDSKVNKEESETLEPDSHLKTSDEVLVKESLQHCQNSAFKDADSNVSPQKLENSVQIPYSANLWTCPLCNSNFPNDDQNSHFVKCVEQFQSHSDLENHSTVSKSFICEICKEDISFLSVEARSIHMNKCIDKQTSSEVDPSGASAPQSTPLFSECPLCFKNFATIELRSMHVKKCSKSLGISIEDTIGALQLQERHVLERISLGLPLPVTKPPRVKSGDKVQKKLITQPKSKSASDIQLAKALSLSMKEEEDKKQEIITSLDNLNSSPSTSFVASLKPPKVGQVPGKKIPKRKKNVNKPVPQLLIRTEDERENLIQERVSKIIQLQVASCETVKSVPSNDPSTSQENSSLTEKHALWNLAGKADNKKVYYVGNLLDWITPSEINAGSKLLNLSQVPGHSIYTQKSCDYTFSSPRISEQNHSQAKNSFTIPSTQEMLDVIMSDSSQVVADSASEKNPFAINLSHNEVQDGFFFEGKKSEMTTGSEAVINSLNTLVGNPWMSDVDIFVGNEKIIPAHKLLLMLRCPALKKNLSDSCGEKSILNWRDIPYEAALNFISYLYTGNEYWGENKMEIYCLAIRYEMNDLQTSLKNKNVSNNDNEIFDAEKTMLSENVPFFVKDKVIDDEENPANKFSGDVETANNCDFVKMESVTLNEEKYLPTVTDKKLASDICDDEVAFTIRNNIKSTQDTEISFSPKNSEGYCLRNTENAASSSCLPENNITNASKCESTEKQKKSNLNDEVLTVQHKISELNPSRTYAKKPRVPSPILFVCGSDDENVTESVLNNTTVFIAPKPKQGRESTDKTAITSYDQSLLKPGFGDSNEITIIHESPRPESITKGETDLNSYLSPNNRHSNPINQMKNEKNEFDVARTMDEMETAAFVNDGSSFIRLEAENTPDVIDCRFEGKISIPDCNITDRATIRKLSNTPVKKCDLLKSSFISSDKSEDCEIFFLDNKPMSSRKLNSNSETVSTSQVLNICDNEIENHEVMVIDNHKTSIKPSTPSKHNVNFTENSHKLLDVPEMHDSNVKKHDIMILGNISSSRSPKVYSQVDMNINNGSKLNSCVSGVSRFKEDVEVFDLSESPIPSPNSEPDTFEPEISSAMQNDSCFDKSLDKDEIFASSQKTLNESNVQFSPTSVISPTSIKCALAAEKRRCAKNSDACVQNLQKAFNSMSDQESMDSEKFLSNDVDDVCDDEKATPALESSSLNQGVTRTYTPVFLSSDEEDEFESDTQNLPEVFEDPLKHKFSLVTTKKGEIESEVKNFTPKKTSLAELSPASSQKCSKSPSAFARRMYKGGNSFQNLNEDNGLCIDLEDSSNDSIKQLAISQPENKIQQSNQKRKTGSNNHISENTPLSKEANSRVAFKISDSPLTPLPDYKSMQTPDVKMALKKYGIRPLPKKKAIAILSHIYDETHPWVDDGTAMCSSQVYPPAASTDVEQQENKKKRKLPAKSVNKNAMKVPKKSKRDLKQNPKLQSSSGFSNSDNSDVQQSIGHSSQESPDENSLSQSPDSSKSDDNDLPEESILHFTDTCENEEIGAEDEIRDKIQKYILSNESLYMKILMYEPLNLNDLQDELRTHKIKIAVPKLMNFLDEQCITFTFPRKDDYRKRQQAQQQKFRKKMITKLSQPNSTN